MVLPLVRLLQLYGQKVLVDQRDLVYGEVWKERLAGVLRQSDRLLLFWSKTSGSSPFVAEECRLALASSGCRIVPILLDRTPLPSELQRLHGAKDLSPMFRKLRRIRMAQRVLWPSWVVLALGLAVAVPVVIFGPIEGSTLLILSFVVWLVGLAPWFFLLHQWLLARSQVLYRTVAVRLGEV
jgi:hypothetical protein